MSYEPRGDSVFWAVLGGFMLGGVFTFMPDWYWPYIGIPIWIGMGVMIYRSRQGIDP